MKLSVDNINKASPYWVIQLDDMQFRFRTKNGVTYRIGFYPDKFFMPGKAFHFYIANIDNARPPKDPAVAVVISLVLEEFFRQDSSVMLYVCDPKDHRERVRAALYKRWYDNYNKKDELVMRAVDIDFNGFVVYSGLIIRKDNPDSEAIIEAFDNFAQKAPTIYNITPK